MSKEQLNFKVNIDGETSNLEDKLKAVLSDFNKLGKNDVPKNIQASFDKIGKALTELRNKTATPLESMSAFSGIDKENNKVAAEIKNIAREIESLYRLSQKEKIALLPDNEQKKLTDATKAIANFSEVREQTKKKTDELIEAEKRLEKAQSNENRLKSLNDQRTALKDTKALLDNITKAAQDYSKAVASANIARENLSKKGFEGKDAITNAKTTIKDKASSISKSDFWKTNNRYQDAAGRTRTRTVNAGTVRDLLESDKNSKDKESKLSSEDVKILKDYLDLAEKTAEAEKKTNNELAKRKNYISQKSHATKEIADIVPAADSFQGKNTDTTVLTKRRTSINNELEENNNQIKKVSQDVENYSGTVKDATEKVDDLTEAWQAQSKSEIVNAYKAIQEALEKVGVELEGLTGDESEDEIFARLNTNIEQAKDNLAGMFDTNVDDAKEGFEGVKDASEDLAAGLGNAKKEAGDFDEVLKSKEAFQSRASQFVGLTGALNTLKTALKSAFNTVRELDSIMTEMAVVTDLDIGDYWEQLPEYTKRANELGLSIGSVYKSDTLLYQQGLKTKEVIDISTESMKMARIASLDTEEATNRLTAALRGFNMELTQENAQRVSDVYSELAAISASDVNEISTAMSKTASIASSAGMSFEFTSSALATMVEATRENADAIGTSLKKFSA